MDFYWEYYNELNPDLKMAGLRTPSDLMNHYMRYGRKENRRYRFNQLYPNFDSSEYKAVNQNLRLNSNIEYEYHYFSVGRHQNIPINREELFKNIDIKKFLEDNKNLELIGIKDIEDAKKYYVNIELRDPQFKTNITKPKIGLFLIGFGMPNIEIKLDILVRNLEILKKWKDIYTLDLHIYMYNPEFAGVLGDINFIDYVNSIDIVCKPGIVGEFIYNDVSKIYNNYDYNILFLDDIELHRDFDLEKLLKVYNLEGLDILSLPLTIRSPHSHTFMLQQLDMIKAGYTYRETNFAELFFYFISSKSFPKYLSLFTKNTRWCWGIDLALGEYGFKIGILEIYPITHYFIKSSYSSKLPCPNLELKNAKLMLKSIKNKIVVKKEKY
jgi:hypothetical protein